MHVIPFTILIKSMYYLVATNYYIPVNFIYQLYQYKMIPICMQKFTMVNQWTFRHANRWSWSPTWSNRRLRLAASGAVLRAVMLYRGKDPKVAGTWPGVALPGVPPRAVAEFCGLIPTLGACTWDHGCVQYLFWYVMLYMIDWYWLYTYIIIHTYLKIYNSVNNRNHMFADKYLYGCFLNN